MGATIKDIAKKTGLGLATISKYLNGGNVLEKNREAIDLAIKELNYTVNEFGRSLKTSKSKTIGVVIPELNNIFVTSIITVLEDVLRKNGYSIIVCDCRTDPARERDVIEFLMAKRVDGIINMPSSSTGEHLEPALQKNIPVVLIDRLVEGVQTDAVMVDNKAASKEAAELLIENGHRNIGIIVGPETIFTSVQRLQGYEQALAGYGQSVNAKHIAFSDYSVQGGYKSLKALLEGAKEMTAVLVTNYEMTLGAIIAINELGIKIPEELSFIGFDNLQLSRVIKPRLTIVDQPLDKIGTQAAKLMLERLKESAVYDDIKEIRLNTELIVRESVRQI